MYYQNPYFYYPVIRQYPSIDISIFEHSVIAFQKTVGEASIILKKFSEPPFANRLMSAAQTGSQGS